MGKKMYPVTNLQAQQGSKVMRAFNYRGAGEGLTHRQLCSSSQASQQRTPTYQDSQGHPSLLLLPPMLTKSILKVIDLGVRMLNKNLILRACSRGGV